MAGRPGRDGLCEAVDGLMRRGCCRKFFFVNVRNRAMACNQWVAKVNRGGIRGTHGRYMRYIWEGWGRALDAGRFGVGV